VPQRKTKRWYRYTSDNTKDYRIQLSEEEAYFGRFEECGEEVELLPNWIKPRYVWLRENTQGKPRRRKVLLQKGYAAQMLPGQKCEIAGIEMYVSSCFGERRRVPRSLRNV